MKKGLLVLTLFYSLTILANPFDQFLGDYKVVSVPTVKSYTPLECKMFDFENLAGLRVEQSVEGNRTHLLHFLSPSGSKPSPIKHFVNDGGGYATTTGSEGMARNVWGGYIGNLYALIITIQTSGSQYLLTVAEEKLWGSTVKTLCDYDVMLEKLPQ